MKRSKSCKAKHRFIFMRKNSFWNLSSSSTVKSLSPVIMTLTEKYLRMLKRKPSDKQVTSHVFAAEHHEWLRWKSVSQVFESTFYWEKGNFMSKNLQITASQPQTWHVWLDCGILPTCSPGPYIGKSSQHIPTPTKPESVCSCPKCSVWWSAAAWDQSNSTVQSFCFKRELPLLKGTCLSSWPYAMDALSIF